MKLVVSLAMASMLMSCGLKQSDSSEAKYTVVADGESFHDGYDVYVPQLDKHLKFKNEAEYKAYQGKQAALMSYLLQISANHSKELELMKDNILGYTLRPGSKFTTNSVNRTCQSEQELGEPGQTIYT